MAGPDPDLDPEGDIVDRLERAAAAATRVEASEVARLLNDAADTIRALRALRGAIKGSGPPRAKDSEG